MLFQIIIVSVIVGGIFWFISYKFLVPKIESAARDEIKTTLKTFLGTAGLPWK